MIQTCFAYMPLASYPEVAADESVFAAIEFANLLNCSLQVATFAVHIPHVSSPLGSILIDIPGLVHSAEKKSRSECYRLQDLVKHSSAEQAEVVCVNREVALGAVLDFAAEEARYFDLSILPWSSGNITAREIAQAVLFGSGRPIVLAPVSSPPKRLDHFAIAWDGSAVAARALGDALPLLPKNGRISVLTVRNEKELGQSDFTGTLVAMLHRRGFSAEQLDISLGEKAIAEALQDAALEVGAHVLVMGGYGHSRIRDFVLGGATKGVLTMLKLPVLLSH